MPFSVLNRIAFISTRTSTNPTNKSTEFLPADFLWFCRFYSRKIYLTNIRLALIIICLFLFTVKPASAAFQSAKLAIENYLQHEKVRTKVIAAHQCYQAYAVLSDLNALVPSYYRIFIPIPEQRLLATHATPQREPGCYSISFGYQPVFYDEYLVDLLKKPLDAYQSADSNTPDSRENGIQAQVNLILEKNGAIKRKATNSANEPELFTSEVISIRQIFTILEEVFTLYETVESRSNALMFLKFRKNKNQ